MRLTSKTVEHLAPPEKGQKIHFDDALRGFGIRLSQGGSKTWVIVHGTQRKLQSLGRYPELGLGDARKRAVVALEAFKPSTPTKVSKPFPDTVQSFLDAKRKSAKHATVHEYEKYLRRMLWTKPIGGEQYKDIFKHAGGALMLIATVSESNLDNILSVVKEEFPQGCNYIMGQAYPEYGYDFHPRKTHLPVFDAWKRSNKPPFVFQKT